MAKIYERCEEDHQAQVLARELVSTHHRELQAGLMGDGNRLRLCIMMVSSDNEKEEHPLKANGWPQREITSIIPLLQRVDKRADAQILICLKSWESLTDNQRRALIDRAITSLQVEKDENGFIITDDAGRPKLSLRLPDYRMSGFRSIAKRYGADAIEVMDAQQWERDFGQDVLLRDNLFVER